MFLSEKVMEVLDVHGSMTVPEIFESLEDSSLNLKKIRNALTNLTTKNMATCIGTKNGICEYALIGTDNQLKVLRKYLIVDKYWPSTGKMVNSSYLGELR